MEIINYKGNVLNILGSVDQPYFIGAEIGRLLGYIKPRNAICKFVWNHNKILLSDLDIPAPIWGGSIIPSNSVLLNEAGMYQLIFSSQLENAKRFQQFILDILPKLRKQQLIIDTPKLICNQIVIKTEMDLHQNVVAYIRK